MALEPSTVNLYSPGASWTLPAFIGAEKTRSYVFEPAIATAERVKAPPQSNNLLVMKVCPSYALLDEQARLSVSTSDGIGGQYKIDAKYAPAGSLYNPSVIS